MTFQRDKVFLRPHLKFSPKVVSDFHLNKLINLSLFFLKPLKTKGENKLYTLDVARTLLYYIERTKPCRLVPYLFIAIAGYIVKVKPFLHKEFQGG